MSTHFRIKRSQISLPELVATALVILLLTGLMLFGEKAIWARHSRMIVSDLRTYAQAVEQFRQTYGRLPGDLDRDGEMDDTDPLTELEEQNLAFLKLSPLGSPYRIGWVSALPDSIGSTEGNAIQVGQLSISLARMIDRMVDGTPEGRKTGRVRYIITDHHARLFYLLETTP